MTNISNTPDNAIDVWLRFDDDADEEATYEANTYPDGDGYRIEWYHNTVGLVTRVYCDTLNETHQWYANNGYEDYTDPGHF